MSKINRRDFIKSTVLISGATLLKLNKMTLASQIVNNKKPNFLFIISDQMVIDAISSYQKYYADPAYTCHWTKTPHIDNMIENSVSFIESHSANPICSPARSCLFTGRMSSETGVIENNIGIDVNVPNLGQWLEDKTIYERVYCGKWHAGGPWNVPDVYGPRIIPGFEILPNGPGDFGRFMDYGIAGAAEAYLRNHSNKNPFLLVASFMNPHDICFWGPPINEGRNRGTDFFKLGDKLPVLPPNQNYNFKEIWHDAIPTSELDAMKWRNYLYDYDRMVERIDNFVGRLLKAVHDRGDDTIVIFTSDHGDGQGRHRRIEKWHPYQDSIKVPLIVYGPKFGIKKNVVDTEHLVHGTDIVSTICDYAGIESPPNVRGYSLRSLLEGKKVSKWRDNVYIELRRTGRIIKTKQYKYVMAYKESRKSDRKTLESVFLTKDGKASEFIQGEGRRFQVEPVKMLFDIKNDPWEMNNLAENSKYKDVIAEYENILHNEWEDKLLPGHQFTRDYK